MTALAIGGCAGDEPALTKFHQLSENEFIFEARMDLEHSENDPKAEATLMAWLEKALADRHLCPGGYTITGKIVFAAQEEALGQIPNIAYLSVCKWTEPV
jgi:hypothetical protein